MPSEGPFSLPASRAEVPVDSRRNLSSAASSYNLRRTMRARAIAGRDRAAATDPPHLAGRDSVEEWADACRREQLISFFENGHPLRIRDDLNCVIG
jgi:hypothetical protein